MATAWLGIGSNVGDREEFCRRAVELLRSSDGLEVTALSGLYETTPVGGPPQRSYLNLVARVETDHSPAGLLELCKRIEARLGREPSDVRFGPRVVDLDVLLYGDQKVSEPDLEIPHPRMKQRRFVLVPLLEIDPDASDPWGERYTLYVDEAEGEVRRIKDLEI